MAAWISTSLAEKTAEKRREGILRTSDDKKNRYVFEPPLMQSLRKQKGGGARTDADMYMLSG
jgi:hypothetical protein